MKRKTRLTAAFILTLFFSAIAGTCVIPFGRANPYLYEQVSHPVSPPPEIEPPLISILSPKNATTVISGNVSLNFNLTVTIPVMPELFYSYLGLSDVYYKASWLPDNIHLDLTEIQNSIPIRTRTFSNDSREKWGTYWALSGYTLNKKFSINLTEIPEGPQSIEVFAVESGSRKYSHSGITINVGRYTLSTSSVVHFAVDNIIILSPQNKTFEESDISLLFEAHNSWTQISYSLDGQSRVIVSGNTTLNGLVDGYHNVTVYATDKFGNIGASETMYFSVDVPFPTMIVIAPVGSMVFVGAGLLVYFKKVQRGKSP